MHEYVHSYSCRHIYVYILDKDISTIAYNNN
jgi:hypothetical protein